MAADEDDAHNVPATVLAWLDAQQPYTVTVEGGGVIIECGEDEFDAVIGERPPVSSLKVMCRQRVDLRASSDAGNLRGFTVHLVADESTSALCRLQTRDAAIKCSAREAADLRARHELVVESSASIEIVAGDWHIDAMSGAEPKPDVWLFVKNTASSLRISSDTPVTYLESTGSHEYDLRNPPERTQINTADGTTTLRQPLQSSEAIGTGNLRVLNSVTDSHINSHDDLEVHGHIENTEFFLGGDLEALGNVTLGKQGLHCRNAVIRGGLNAASPVECDSLDVAGPLESSGSVKLQKLRCSGTLKVAQLEVAQETTIAGGAQHSRPNRAR